MTYVHQSKRRATRSAHRGEDEVHGRSILEREVGQPCYPQPMKPVIFWQSPEVRKDEGYEIAEQAEAAQALGCDVVPLPYVMDTPELVKETLSYLPRFDSPRWGAWIGTIPTEAIYRQVYALAAARGVFLLNNPDQHLTVFEFHRAYSHIASFTPKSVAIRDVSEAKAAADSVGFPVFVKGALASRKAVGWDACVANDHDHLNDIVSVLFDRPRASRGVVIVRALAPVIRREVGSRPFPASREFRVFCLNGEVMGFGYYWGFLIDDMYKLDDAEEKAMLDVARAAAAALPVPWVSLDIAQLEDKRWIVIEPGDPQFSGLSFIEAVPLWENVVHTVDAMPAPSGSLS